MQNYKNPGQPSYFHPLTYEDKAIFDEALQGFVGSGFRPVAVSKQVIDGLMRIYFCDATMITNPLREYFAFVYIAQLIDGTIKLEKIQELKPVDMDITGMFDSTKQN